MATKVLRLSNIGKLSNVVEKVCYIKDVKANNTAGGTATAGSYQTRTLNTLEGDTSFVSLASNQFTLQPGTYHIEAEAPANSVASNSIGMHKIRLRDITNSTTTIVGQNAMTQATGSTTVDIADAALLKGVFTIATATTFEIQHRVLTTQSGQGFGRAANFGDSEVYTQVKITKIETIDEAY
jgi:hypothetical protein